VPKRLSGEGMIVPAPPHRPWFGAWIMPDNASSGALEDFSARLVRENDALWSRAGDAIDGIPHELRRFTAGQRGKAHIHTYLAWQKSPGSPMGQAITQGNLDAQAPLATAFVGWLRRLMVEDLP
jgi:hypothetical protein